MDIRFILMMFYWTENTFGISDPLNRSTRTGWINGPKLYKKLDHFIDHVVGHQYVQVSLNYFMYH